MSDQESCAWVPQEVMADLCTPRIMSDPFIVDPKNPPSAVELLAGVRYPSDKDARVVRMPDVHFGSGVLGDWMQEWKP